SGGASRSDALHPARPGHARQHRLHSEAERHAGRDARGITVERGEAAGESLAIAHHPGATPQAVDVPTSDKGWGMPITDGVAEPRDTHDACEPVAPLDEPGPQSSEHGGTFE